MAENKTVLCVYIAEVNGKAEVSVRDLPAQQFSDGNVTIRVSHSSLNFKDTLACQGHRGIIRRLPHVPGIDLAGTVLSSCSAEFKPGDEVLVTGYDLGQGHWGGWSQLACVPDQWIVKLPATLSQLEAMFIGTAGFTAAQCLVALQRNGVNPGSGPVVVTGATGGVGSLAVRLLAQEGYQVVAATGKPQCHQALRELGAREVISREELCAGDISRPMLSARWAGAIDTVGGTTLCNLLKSTMYGGCVAACGLVAGHQLEMTVYPFLLRGVTLCGVASADCPMDQRLEIWRRLAGSWKPMHQEIMSTVVSLEQIPALVTAMSQGQIAGRVVVKCSD